MFTIYVDPDLSSKGMEAIKASNPFPMAMFNAKNGMIGFQYESGEFPFLLGRGLVDVAHQKRFGIVEPGVIEEGCLAPDTILTQDDLKQIQKEWL